MSFADQRVLQHIPATLSAQFVDQDGAPHSPVGAVTVGVTRADGTALLAPGQATTAGATAGVRTIDVTAVQTALLDHLECTWTAATGEVAITHVDVVGAYYFTLSDLSSLDGMTGLTIDQKRLARQAVEEIVEVRTGWVWTPRLVVDTVQVADLGWYGQRVGYPSSYMLTRRPVRALRQVAIDGVAAASTDWTNDGWGLIGVTHNWALATSKVVQVIYEAGEDRPPVALTQALMDAARQSHVDRKSGTPRALGVTNEYGNISYARATAENLFGTPAVDAVLAFWDRRLPRMASA